MTEIKIGVLYKVGVSPDDTFPLYVRVTKMDEAHCTVKSEGVYDAVQIGVETIKKWIEEGSMREVSKLEEIIKGGD